MAKENKNKPPVNHAGRPTGSYSSYGTSGYGAPYGGGYGSAGNGAYGRSPYGAQPVGRAGMQQPAAAPVKEVEDEKENKKAEKATKSTTKTGKASGGAKGKKGDKPDYSNLKGKQKKLAKKQAKFDENDLRNYPMTVGGWIGTFALLCLFPLSIIFIICWFFGVGNRSRTAWVRSYVVVALVIVLIFCIIVGAGLGVLSSKSKNVAVEIDGEKYGTLGDYGFKGMIYYLVSSSIDVFGEDLILQIMGKVGGGEGGEGDEISTGDVIKELKKELAISILGIDTSKKGEAGPSGGGEIGSGETGSGETGSGDLETGGEGGDIGEGGDEDLELAA